MCMKLAVMAMFIVSCPFTGMAQSSEGFVYDSLYYGNLEGNEVWVGAWTGWMPTGNLVIPDTVEDDGKKYVVTQVGHSADGSSSGFGMLEGLVSVTMPNTIRRLDNYCFVRCPNLTEVCLSDSIESIGWGAFSGCSRLNAVQLGPVLEVIENEAFYNCTNFDSLYLPEKVREIGDQAFELCNLWHIDVAEDNAYFMSEEGILYNKNRDIIWLYPPMKPGSSFVIPSTVTYVKNQCFADAGNLKQVTIPVSVKKLGFSSFNKAGLTSVHIPDSVTLIEHNVFNGCSALKEAYIGKSVERMDNGVFYRTRLSEVDLPDKLAWMGDAVFDGTNIDSLYLPASLVHLGEDALNGIRKLYTVEVDEANPVFADVNGVLYNKAKDTVLFCPLQKEGDITMPEGLRHVRKRAFLKCEKIASVTMPNTVLSAGPSAFEQCRSLEKVVLSTELALIDTSLFKNCSKLHTVNIPKRIRSVENDVFSYCTSLQELGFPNTVERIGANAFSGCRSLKAIYLPDDIQEMPFRMLAECDSLLWVKIPDKIESIGEQVFSGCKSIDSLVVPDGVKAIGDRAFALMDSLKFISLPADLEFLGPKLFFSDGNLTHIICEDPVPPVLGEEAFSSANTDFLLTVPCGAAADYEDAPQWGSTENIREGLFYDLHLTVNDTSMGTAVQVGEAPVCENPELILLAQPRVGHYFVQWSDGCQENPYAMPIEGGLVEIEAEFAPVPPSLFVITWTVPEGGWITVTCEDTVVNSGAALDSGRVLTLKVEALEGYDFVQWWDGNTDTERTYELKSDITISAEFSKQEYVLTIEQAEGGAVTVTCDGEALVSGVSVEYGSVLELKAMAADGYVFEAKLRKHWVQKESRK